jgi:protein-S-isoprenylcysteine O-methyltransferase Ste14
MRDILKGAFGMFLTIILVILGFAFLFGGIFSANIIAIIIGILCFCFAFGIRYWLGHIIRHR